MVILLSGCSSEETLLESDRKDAVKLQTVSFSDLAKNQGALRAYRAYNSKLEAERLQARGISFYGVLVDTTKIYYTEKGDLKSYTFEILDFESRDTIKNLILQQKGVSEYAAYVAKYAMTPTDKQTLIEGGSLIKTPIKIENESVVWSIFVYGNGSDCVKIYTHFVDYYDDGYGNIHPGSGDIDRGDIKFINRVEETVFEIDVSCLRNNGGFSDTGDVGNTSGSGGTTGGGGNTSSTGGSSSTPSNGSGPINPDLISLPIFNINRTEMRILANLNPLQTQWWNTANPEIKTQLREILSVWNQENLEFVKDIINYLNENGNSPEALNEVRNIIELTQNGTVNNQQVLEAPDDPINDMADYLSCFDTSQPAVIRLYADQPVNGSQYILSIDGNVGHAFISIIQGTKVKTLGFYPQNSAASIVPNPTTLDPRDFISVPGVFGNDEGHTFDVSISKAIAPSNLANLIIQISSLANNNLNYNLGSVNCTDIAINFFELSTSLDIPSAESPSPWKGQTPGTLGEILRNLNLPQGVTRNIIPGTAPINSSY